MVRKRTGKFAELFARSGSGNNISSNLRMSKSIPLNFVWYESMYVESSEITESKIVQMMKTLETAKSILVALWWFSDLKWIYLRTSRAKQQVIQENWTFPQKYRLNGSIIIDLLGCLKNMFEDFRIYCVATPI